MTSADSIVFRDIKESSDFHEVERLQKIVWAVEDVEIVPAIIMKPLVEVGGILIGAFIEDKMIGFVLGFAGRDGDQNIIHSDMLAVLPEYRSFGLGFRLKLAQRERALANGIQTITWTYDPLRAINANLNFARLGVTSDRYEIDYYGETSSVLHRLGTDRLWVKWPLLSKRTIARIKPDLDSTDTSYYGKDPVTLVAVGEKQQPIIRDEFNIEDALIEIPTNLDELLKQQPQLAADWRAATRKAFTRAISAGYIVHDFIINKEARKGTYLLMWLPQP